MEKKFLLFITALLAVAFVSTANAISQGDCESTVACINQEGNKYCLPSDTVCSFTRYELSDSACVVSDAVDTDTDADGWSDKCDAFPDSSEEWMDIDGDGVGHNSDCDDYNPENTSVCNNDGDTPDVKIKGGGRSPVYCTPTWECTDWGKCVMGIKARECTKTNECPGEDNKPATEKGCPLLDHITTVSDEVPAVENTPSEPKPSEEKPYVVEMNMPNDEGKEGNSITGRFLSFTGGKGSVLIGILVIAMLVLLFMAATRKRQ